MIRFVLWGALWVVWATTRLLSFTVAGEGVVVAAATGGAAAAAAVADDRIGDTEAGNPSPSPRTTSAVKKPHIIFIVLDDLGSHDLGMHGSGIDTSHIDGLADTGIYLDNYYTFSKCTLTRIAFMTGRYPYESGNYVTVATRHDQGMNLTDETLPELLQQKGNYATHAVGKWHLGHAMYEQTPTYRGFQSFFGFSASGALDYFNHTYDNGNDDVAVYAMRWDKKQFCGPGCSQLIDERGNYSTHVFTREALRVIEDHGQAISSTDKNQPLFLYVAYQAVHKPLQVPQNYINQYNSKSEWSEGRKIYAGMLTAADEGVGMIIQKLKDTGLWEDSLIIVTTDNGGPVPAATQHLGEWSGEDGSHAKSPASNFPLRGGKQEVYEGGISGDALLSGPALDALNMSKGTTFDSFFHAMDWLPTLAEMIGETPANSVSADVDGVSQYTALVQGDTVRTNGHCGFSVTVEDPASIIRYSAYKDGEMKLIWDNVDSRFSSLYNLTEDVREKNDLSKDPAFKLLMGQLREKMLEFEVNFSDKILGRDNRDCQYSLGLTPWNEPAAHAFCNESEQTTPTPTNSPTHSVAPSDSPSLVPTVTSIPTISQAPSTTPSRSCRMPMEECIRDGNCCRDLGIAMYCATDNPSNDPTLRCMECAKENDRCGNRRPLCCAPFQCQKADDGIRYCLPRTPYPTPIPTTGEPTSTPKRISICKKRNERCISNAECCSDDGNNELVCAYEDDKKKKKKNAKKRCLKCSKNGAKCGDGKPPCCASWRCTKGNGGNHYCKRRGKRELIITAEGDIIQN